MLLIMWDDTKTSRKPNSGFADTICSYQSQRKSNRLYIIRRLQVIDSHFISYFIDFCSKRPLTNPYLLLQFSCMASTSQSCSHVRECWSISFVMLTRFCLTTKTDFVWFFLCSLSIILKYYTQMLFMVPSLVWTFI